MLLCSRAARHRTGLRQGPASSFLDHDPYFDRLVMPLATRHREA